MCCLSMLDLWTFGKGVVVMESDENWLMRKSEDDLTVRFG